MAVVSHTSWTYSDSVGRMNSALEAQGAPPMFFQQTITKAAGDNNASTYMILPRIPSNYMIASLEYETAGLAGMTSVDIGIYDADTGAAVSAACYAAAVDMSVAKTKVAPGDATAALTGSNTKKAVYDVAGKDLTTRKGHYDLVATANTAGGAAGTITFRGMLVPLG